MILSQKLILSKSKGITQNYISKNYGSYTLHVIQCCLIFLKIESCRADTILSQKLLLTKFKGT